MFIDFYEEKEQHTTEFFVFKQIKCIKIYRFNEHQFFLGPLPPPVV